MKSEISIYSPGMGKRISVRKSMITPYKNHNLSNPLRCIAKGSHDNPALVHHRHPNHRVRSVLSSIPCSPSLGAPPIFRLHQSATLVCRRKRLAQNLISLFQPLVSVTPYGLSNARSKIVCKQKEKGIKNKAGASTPLGKREAS